MRRQTSVLATVVALGLSATVVTAQLIGRGPATSRDQDPSPSAVDPALAARGARYLLRNGIDWVNYKEYGRALRFLRAAEANQGELDAAEVKALKQAIASAQRGLREAAPAGSLAGDRTHRPGAIASARNLDNIQLAGATRDDAPAPTSAAPGPVPAPADREPAARRASATPADRGGTDVPLPPAELPDPAGRLPEPAPAPPPAPSPEPAGSGDAAPPQAPTGPAPASLPDLPPMPAPGPEPMPAPGPSAPRNEGRPVIGLDPLPGPAPKPDEPAAPSPAPVPTPPAMPDPIPAPAPAPASPAPGVPEPGLPPSMPELPGSGPDRPAPAPVPDAVPTSGPAPAPAPSPPQSPDPRPVELPQLPSIPQDPAPPPPAPTPDPTPMPAPMPVEHPAPASPDPMPVPSPSPDPVPAPSPVEPSPVPVPGAEPAPTPAPAAEELPPLPAEGGRAPSNPAGLTGFAPKRPITDADREAIDRRIALQERESRARPADPSQLPRTVPIMPVPGPPVPGDTPAITTNASTRFELTRPPSPTEAWPLRRVPIPEEFVPLQPREWQPAKKYWQAPALCHMPLYFQDASLERYGHSVESFFGTAGRYLTYPIDSPNQTKQRFQILQPAFSAGLMAFQVGMLPYNLIVDPPWEAEYDLGYYRPADRIPTDTYYFPLYGVGPPLRGSRY